MPHPCHWVGPSGRCAGPATRRFYDPNPPDKPASLSGVHMKLSVTDTFACDEHWQVFQGMLRAREAKVKPAAAQG